MDQKEEDSMTTRRERKLGLSLAGSGVGVVGVAIVFGLTTAGGGPDWVEIITAIAGVVMIFTGLFQAFRGDTPHAA
jgi:sulfite exporter TauE/SafE